MGDALARGGKVRWGLAIVGGSSGWHLRVIVIRAMRRLYMTKSRHCRHSAEDIRRTKSLVCVSVSQSRRQGRDRGMEVNSILAMSTYVRKMPINRAKLGESATTSEDGQPPAGGPDDSRMRPLMCYDGLLLQTQVAAAVYPPGVPSILGGKGMVDFPPPSFCG